MNSISAPAIPSASFSHIHCIGRVLHSYGPLTPEHIIAAVRRSVPPFSARRVLTHLLKLQHLEEDNGMIDISPTLRAHYDDVDRQAKVPDKNSVPLTPARLRYEFKPLSARHIPSSHGTRPDAPRREVPSFITLGGWDVDDKA